MAELERRPGRSTLTQQRTSNPEASTPGKRTLTERAGSGAGQAMPQDVQHRMESAMGADFSAVRIHEGGESEAIGALAFTRGDDVHFAPGNYQPGSLAGQELLGHELAHVVQQRQGRVQATAQAKGLAVNDDAGLEREADEMGAHAARGERADVGEVAMPASAGAASVVQRKIGAKTKDNVIFGLSGRNAEQIQAAVDAGYETFDGADSYGDTIHLLAAALEKANVARGAVEVIYKVDSTKPDALEGHLRDTAKALGGYLDHVLIHKATDREQAKQYQPVLAKLKLEGVIKSIGAGDVKPDMAEHFEGKDAKDSFEIDASALFLASDADELIKKLNEAGKPVFVYNIVATLRPLLKLDSAARPSQSQLSAMVTAIRTKVPTAEPILSSGTTETIEANKEIDTPQDDGIAFDAYKTIEKGLEKEDKAVPVAEMDGHVKELVGSLLFGEFEWSATEMFDDVKKYEEARNKQLAQFTDKQLAVRYEHGKEHTLGELIHMLFDPTGNCHRVEAANFLGAAM